MHILSPLPGIFYHKPSPEKPAFKQSGDPVVPGDVIGLVEVMKTFVEVKSEIKGTFKAYIRPNEDAISPGDVLAEVEAET